MYNMRGMINYENVLMNKIRWLPFYP